MSSGRRSGQRFDAEHGVVTEALIFLGQLDPQAIGDALDDATHYEATPVAEFTAMLDALPVSPEGLTFVDLGAGMGRTLMLASLRPFKQVLGVEVSPALCETARDNLVRWRRARSDLRCTDLRVVHTDASRFALPPGPVVVYLYNPFGEESVTRVASQIAVREPPCYVLYHTPLHRAVFETDTRFERIARLPFGCVYERV